MWGFYAEGAKLRDGLGAYSSLRKLSHRTVTVLPIRRRNRSTFHQKDHDFRMWMAAGIGVVVGMFLILLLPRFLPFSAYSRVDSYIMGHDRIKAAYAMINSVDPLGVKKLEWGQGSTTLAAGRVPRTAKAPGRRARIRNVPLPCQRLRSNRARADNLGAHSPRDLCGCRDQELANRAIRAPGLIIQFLDKHPHPQFM